MRIIAIELTETRQRVAYRWTETPFDAPRLLIDGARTSAAELRATLEAILGEAMHAGDYRIVVRANDLEAVRDAFGDLEIIGDAPNDAEVFALTEWRLEPPGFDALADYIEATLIDPLADAEQARTEFQKVRDAIRVTIAGRSALALAEVYRCITGEAIRLPRTPSSQPMAERRFQGVPITVLDLRSAVAADPAIGMLLVLAVASDPGIGQEELVLKDRAEQTIVAVVNTHEDERHFAAMTAYIQEEVGATSMLTDVEQIGTGVRGAIERAIKARLSDWIEALPAYDEMRRNIERFTLT